KGSGGSSSIPNIGSMPQLGQDYLRLMRNFKIQEAVLEMLSKQFEAVKIGESKDMAPFQVLQKAKAPERKSKPKRSIIVLAATFAAFSFSILMAFACASYNLMTDIIKLRWKTLFSFGR
ncbi:MAG: lipopolysaccharide biosynthesis, partial [uncultured bacterium]